MPSEFDLRVAERPTDLDSALALRDPEPTPTPTMERLNESAPPAHRSRPIELDRPRAAARSAHQPMPSGPTPARTERPENRQEKTDTT